ncbi:uncharacterized protein LOC130821146 [Amaranthus tricolor]|uniref:uncharacterized protein LOC130821146 n=1 Tax=Amaranthus tricolor TaxID=29722 RepID=UPI0025828AB0|nr:uncharacterized protein LOC130821146 [Amaranthus tricolor]
MNSREIKIPIDDIEDPLNKASLAIDNLYLIRNSFYPENPDDKISKLQQESHYCLNLLDSIPPEFRKSTIQRATYEHLKGKVLDVFPDYRKEAEDHLSKAVKLNPSLTDAWLSLGNCFWKKGDLLSAKNCYNRALSKGLDKNVLCQLSMLERKMAQDSENKSELVDESIRHAKEAITLDVADGNSWYNLGNACFTSFFASGAWDHSKLFQSLKAYQNAEKDEKMKGNPDLFFNCATVNKYLENYDKALSGFEAACKIDPALDANGEVQKLVALLDRLETLLKGHTKAKRLASLVSSLVSVEPNIPYKKATVDLLFEGLNKSTAVTSKVLFYVKHENVTPLYYVACDSNQMCFVLSVYGLQDNVIKERDQITLLEPWYKSVGFSWKGKAYSFKSIRVDFKEQIVVNGKTLSAKQATSTSFYAQHKST